MLDIDLCDAGKCSGCGLCSYNESLSMCCSDDDQDTVCNDDDICLSGDDREDADEDGTPDACDTENTQTDCNDGIDNDGDGQCDYFGCPDIGIADRDFGCESLGLPTGGPDMDGLPLVPLDMCGLADYVDQINTQNQELLQAGCPLLY